uniref:UBN2 domain-containing protein n=1 Tax=Tanacetum cinerariifolium TaxID=118510 RepID=A0A6L2KD47_TANCI|nr:UBN2 domain-containing protein [Tanacetum cinerariifolium]
MMKDTPYELLKDDEKKKLSKNNESKMTLYNALPRKEYERVFMCKTDKEVWHTLIITYQGNSQVKNCKIDLLTQEYKKFLISIEDTIDSGFTRINVIVTSLKSLYPDYSSKNHVRNFLRALPLKWRAKLMAIEEAKDLEKVKSLPLKAKVTRKQTSDDSDSQSGSDEDVDEEEEEEGKAFNLMVRNFVSSSTREIDSDIEINLVMVLIGQSSSECRKTKENKVFLKEHEVIVKMTVNLKMMQHVSWTYGIRVAEVLKHVLELS